MANPDQDWDEFMKATQEEPEEVETDDELEDEDLEDEEPEVDEDQEESEKGKEKPGKKSEKTASKETDEEEKDDDAEEDDDEEEKETPAKSDGYKPRLKQFKNEDGTLNAEALEKSYIKTSKTVLDTQEKLKELEGNHNQLLQAIAAKPEIAETLFGKDGAKKLQQNSKAQPGQSGSQKDRDPMLIHLEAQMNNKSRKEYADFVENNPESVTDPERAEKIGRFLKIYGATHREENNGEIPPMGEALREAYRYYGWDVNDKNKEDVAIAAKKTAATRSTSQGKKPASKKKASDAESFFAKKLGVKL